MRRRNRFWHDADIRLPYSSQLRPRIDATNAGAIATPSLDYPAKRVAGNCPARSDRAGPEGRHTMQQRSIPRAPFPTGICEIGSCGSSELWNLRDCNLSPPWGGCHRQNSVRNSAAFLRGRVRHRRCDRGRKRVRLGGGLAAGAKCPPACARGVQDRGGAHSPFLLVVARVSLGLSGAWAGHTLARR